MTRAVALERARATETYREFVRSTMSYYAAVIALGEVVRRVSEDVRDYVTTEAAEAPPPESWRRACAMMEAPEVTSAVVKVASAIASGVARGTSARTEDSGVDARGTGDAGASGTTRGDNFMESLVDILLEPKRLRKVSDFVGETSKSLFGALASVAKDNAEVIRALAGGEAERGERASTSPKPSGAERAVTFLEEPRNKKIVVDVGRELVDAAMASYVRELGDDNMYVDMFQAVRDPANRSIFLEMMRVMVETSVRTYVVTSMETSAHPETTMHTPKSKRGDSPTSPLVSRFSQPESPLANAWAPRDGGRALNAHEELQSPHMLGTWRELFQAATETKENRRLALATTMAATRAAMSGLASGAWDVVVRGTFAGHKLYIKSWYLAMVFGLCSIMFWVFLRVLTFFVLTPNALLPST